MVTCLRTHNPEDHVHPAVHIAHRTSQIIVRVTGISFAIPVFPFVFWARALFFSPP